MSKFKAKKTMVDGIWFDSKKEAMRYRELKKMEEEGLISDLQLQVEYELLPAQREPDKVGPRGGTIKGKVIERKCSYIADFVYIDHTVGDIIVEDVKGVHTKEYLIKRKMMLAFHGIRIKES